MLSSNEVVEAFVARWDGHGFSPPLARFEISKLVAAICDLAERQDLELSKSAALKVLPVVERIHFVDHANLGGDSTRPGWESEVRAFGESSGWLESLRALAG